MVAARMTRVAAHCQIGGEDLAEGMFAVTARYPASFRCRHAAAITSSASTLLSIATPSAEALFLAMIDGFPAGMRAEVRRSATHARLQGPLHANIVADPMPPNE
jgi:hypothetical protein